MDTIAYRREDIVTIACEDDVGSFGGGGEDVGAGGGGCSVGGSAEPMEFVVELHYFVLVFLDRMDR